MGFEGSELTTSPGEDMNASRLRRGELVFAVSAGLYLLAVLAVSASPGPRWWGFHLSGFLAWPIRVLTLIVLASGVVLSFIAATAPPARAPRSRIRIARGVLLRLGLLLAFAGILWALRVRTHFLGDSRLWLSGLRGGTLPSSSEALAQAIWLLAASAARSWSVPIETLAVVSIACGIAALILLSRVARHVARNDEEFVCALALLLTMGVSQLFFGYIESYPIVVVAILAYLVAGFRVARTGTGIVLLLTTFTLAVASHLICLYLAPSFLYLVWRTRQPAFRKAAFVLLAASLPVALLLVLGSGTRPWRAAFDVLRGAAAGSPTTGNMRAYGPLTLDHGVDILNELALVIPVPILLFLAGTATRNARTVWAEPGATFLTMAAACGAAGFLVLVLPLAPAVDWDLMSTLLLPLGILGIWVGRLVYGNGARMMRAAAVCLSLGAFLPFILVNASADAGIHRYAVLIGPDARISSYARRYGYELIGSEYRERGDNAHAMVYADLLLEAAPSDAMSWAIKGQAVMATGDYGRAIPFLKESEKLDPRKATTRASLAMCYSASREYPDALEEYEAAAALDPSRPDYRHNVGLALAVLGKRDSAIVVWRGILRRWPDYLPTLQALSLVDRG